MESNPARRLHTELELDFLVFRVTACQDRVAGLVKQTERGEEFNLLVKVRIEISFKGMKIRLFSKELWLLVCCLLFYLFLMLCLY